MGKDIFYAFMRESFLTKKLSGWKKRIGSFNISETINYPFRLFSGVPVFNIFDEKGVMPGTDLTS